jgi:hypothetical protein
MCMCISNYVYMYIQLCIYIYTHFKQQRRVFSIEHVMNHEFTAPTNVFFGSAQATLLLWLRVLAVLRVRFSQHWIASGGCMTLIHQEKEHGGTSFSQQKEHIFRILCESSDRFWLCQLHDLSNFRLSCRWVAVISRTFMVPGCSFTPKTTFRKRPLLVDDISFGGSGGSAFV